MAGKMVKGREKNPKRGQNQPRLHAGASGTRLRAAKDQAERKGGARPG
jgi:hypothetical protein